MFVTVCLQKSLLLFIDSRGHQGSQFMGSELALFYTNIALSFNESSHLVDNFQHFHLCHGDDYVVILKSHKIF